MENGDLSRCGINIIVPGNHTNRISARFVVNQSKLVKLSRPYRVGLKIPTILRGISALIMWSLNKMSKKITLQDLDIWCENLLKAFPDNPKCAFDGKPVDVTLMGIDTSCPYHRLLHDQFLYNEGGHELQLQMAEGNLTREAYRLDFHCWMIRKGKEVCDAIVLEMASAPLNWEC